MARYVIVSNILGGVALNVADSEIGPITAEWVQSDTAQKGYLWNGSTFSVPPLVLADEQAIKVTHLKSVGLGKIQLVFPAIVDWDILDFEVEKWISIAPAARAATTDFQQVIDIYTAGKNAVVAINAETDVNVVVAYDVETDPAWP